MNDLAAIAAEAGEIRALKRGRKITFYVPGMFCYNGVRGRYPAISLTGANCALQCRHCGGRLLAPMIHAATPEELSRACRERAARGDVGCLLSGGLDADGAIPWREFLPAIKQVKAETGLYISIHSGILDQATAIRLKDAGIDQALIDVIGSDATLGRIYGPGIRVSDIVRTIEALSAAGIPVIPHIVAGLDYGKIVGEYRALALIKDFKPAQVVVVSLMPLPGTPMAGVAAPPAEEVGRLVATACRDMPDAIVALGCARRRGDAEIDVWAVKCGVDRIALPSDEAVALARGRGFEIAWQYTCCSVNGRMH